jgi:phosphatidylserine/phosphatidylglycerophosphate/cardiolipin synthase-like enzyme
MRSPVLSIILAFCLATPAQAFELTLHDTPAEIHFSPRGGATEALVARVDAARESIFVLAYSFTSAPIAEALARAARRGVHVEAVLDRGQRRAKGGQGQRLANSGAAVYIDAKHAIAHNKVMVLDGQAVATGSFNFTGAAEASNAENLLILDSPELARLYLEEWKKHRGHAVPW